MRPRPAGRRFAGCVALVAALSGPAAAQTYTFQISPPPPIIIQDGFGAGGGMLPGDGLEYCVPSSSAMAILNLATINPAFAAFVPSGAGLTTASKLNFDRVLGGLMNTTPANGTDSAVLGVATYLATQGLGTAGTAITDNTTRVETPYYTYELRNTVTLADLLHVYRDNGTYQNSSVASVSTFGIGWYYQSGGVYYSGGGHDLTLAGASVNAAGVYTPGASTVALFNPEPSTLAAVPDRPAYSGQIVGVQEQTLNTGGGTSVSGLVVQANQGTFINGVSYPYGSPGYLALIDEQYVLSVKTALPTTAAELLPWKLADVTYINTNSGTLSVPTTVVDKDGSSHGGIYKLGLGTLTLTNSAAVSGAVTVGGGTLASTVDPNAVGADNVLGVGGVNLNSGTLSLAPSGSGASAAINLASNSTVTYGGGATLALNPGSFGALNVALGGLTRSGSGTLVVAPATGSAALGASVKVAVAGTAPAVTHGIVNPTIVGQNNDATKSGDFLTYGANGFAVATYTDSTGTPVGSTTASTVYAVTDAQTVATGNTASVYALKVESTGSVGGPGTLAVGPQTGGQAGIILNGGTIAAATLQLGAGEGVIYTSLAGGTISSDISGTGGLTTFGPGSLTLNGGNAGLTGAVTVQSGSLTVGSGGALGTGAPVTVNAGAALVVAGTVSGPVTALDAAAQSAGMSVNGNTIITQNGGTVVLDGGTIAGTVSIDPSSFLQGAGTVSGSSDIAGTVGIGSLTPSGGWSAGTPATLTFTGPVTFQSTANLTWTLFDTTYTGAGTAGVDWNTLAFTGTVSHGGRATLLVDLSRVSDPDSGNAFWNQSHTWQVITGGSNFEYATVSVASFVQGGFSGLTESGGSYYLTFTPTPEPATTLGAAAAGLGLAGWVRRRRAVR